MLTCTASSRLVSLRCAHGCRTSTAALSTTWCFEAGYVTRTDTTAGQALWQPGGAEDSCFCEGDRHLRLANDKKEGVWNRVFFLSQVPYLSPEAEAISKGIVTTGCNDSEVLIKVRAQSTVPTYTDTAEGHTWGNNSRKCPQHLFVGCLVT